jgi:GTP-binding protein
MSTRLRGVLVSMIDGTTVAYALGQLQERSTFFVAPGDPVYEGMVVGENSRPGDMEVNVTKGKKLTNMRASGSDENVLLEPPRKMSLEDALGYIADDELIEITPKAFRLRKRLLSANDRKKASRASA